MKNITFVLLCVFAFLATLLGTVSANDTKNGTFAIPVKHEKLTTDTRVSFFYKFALYGTGVKNFKIYLNQKSSGFVLKDLEPGEYSIEGLSMKGKHVMGGSAGIVGRKNKFTQAIPFTIKPGEITLFPGRFTQTLKSTGAGDNFRDTPNFEFIKTEEEYRQYKEKLRLIDDVANKPISLIGLN